MSNRGSVESGAGVSSWSGLVAKSPKTKKQNSVFRITPCTPWRGDKVERHRVWEEVTTE